MIYFCYSLYTEKGASEFQLLYYELYFFGGKIMEYASNGKGNLGVTLGAIGTGLSFFNGSNPISGLFGGGNNANYVTRDMLDLELKVIECQKDNAILNAELNTEKKMVEVFNASNNKTNEVFDRLSNRILTLERIVADNAASQAVINCNASSSIGILQTQVGQLYTMTKMVIPNGNVCPGWGNVEVTVSPTTTTAG